MAFYTIHAREGLPERDYRRALRSRGRGLASQRPYEDLMRAAGFVDVRSIDVTRGYAITSRRWYEENARLETAVRELLGDRVYEDEQRSRERSMRAIADGLIARGLFTGRRP